MDITIYLPDDIAQRAKSEGVNLSRMLRDALTAMFAEEDAKTALLEGAKEYKLALENDEGTNYTGRITGRRIGENDQVEVYLTDKENVLVYDIDKLRYWVEDGGVDLADMIGDQGVYIEVMATLGREAEVDLDV